MNQPENFPRQGSACFRLEILRINAATATAAEQQPSPGAAGAEVLVANLPVDNGLDSASNAHRVPDALLAKDVIDRDNGSFLITDQFFRLWIRSAQII